MGNYEDRVVVFGFPVERGSDSGSEPEKKQPIPNEIGCFVLIWRQEIGNGCSFARVSRRESSGAGGGLPVQGQSAGRAAPDEPVSSEFRNP